jgi:hypothetical protein
LANLASTLALYNKEVKVLLCKKYVIPPITYYVEKKNK